MTHLTHDTPTYKYCFEEYDLESFVRIPLEDLMDTATTIAAEENLSPFILDAASRILQGDTSGLDQEHLQQGHALLEKAANLIIHLKPTAAHRIHREVSPPKPSPTLRRTALQFFHDPVQTQPILELVKNQMPPLRAKDGNWEDHDLKAITFLILEQTEKPGEFVKTLTQTFQAAPPEHTIAQRMFTNILLERARNHIALQGKSSEPMPQHRFPA